MDFFSFNLVTGGQWSVSEKHWLLDWPQVDAPDNQTSEFSTFNRVVSLICWPGVEPPFPQQFKHWWRATMGCGWIRQSEGTDQRSVKLIDAETMEQTFFVGFSFIPESPRWLVVAGRTSKAEILLRKICSVNGREFPDSIDLNVVENVSRSRDHEGQEVIQVISWVSDDVQVLSSFWTVDCNSQRVVETMQTGLLISASLLWTMSYDENCYYLFMAFA